MSSVGHSRVAIPNGVPVVEVRQLSGNPVGADSAFRQPWLIAATKRRWSIFSERMGRRPTGYILPAPSHTNALYLPVQTISRPGSVSG